MHIWLVSQSSSSCRPPNREGGAGKLTSGDFVTNCWLWVTWNLEVDFDHGSFIRAYLLGIYLCAVLMAVHWLDCRHIGRPTNSTAFIHDGVCTCKWTACLLAAKACLCPCGRPWLAARKLAAAEMTRVHQQIRGGGSRRKKERKKKRKERDGKELAPGWQGAALAVIYNSCF